MRQAAPEWFADGEFWKFIVPWMFHEGRWGAASEEISQVLDLIPIRGSGQVLDLCCGPGRHALELARRGYSVTGIDLTEAYVEKARALAERQRLQAEFTQCDMRDLEFELRYDLALNMFTSFGYFERVEDDYRVASKVERALLPGGSFLIEMIGKEVAARHFRAQERIEKGGVVVLEEKKVLGAWERIWFRRTVICRGKTSTYVASHRLYSGCELKELLLTAGFVNPRIYGSLEGVPYDENARRLVVVATKKSL